MTNLQGTADILSLVVQIRQMLVGLGLDCQELDANKGHHLPPEMIEVTRKVSNLYTLYSGTGSRYDVTVDNEGSARRYGTSIEMSTPNGEMQQSSEDVKPYQSPRVFISYAQESADYSQAVKILSDRLRANGINAIIDAYVEAPQEGWPRWMLNQIDDSDYVIMICSEMYNRRVRGKEIPNKGLGASWEGAVITQEIYEAHGGSLKYIPAVLKEQDIAHIPIFVRGQTHYKLYLDNEYSRLYWRLRGQPIRFTPPIGQLLDRDT